MLFLEASGGLVAGPHFFSTMFPHFLHFPPAIFRNFRSFFAIFRNGIGPSLTAIPLEDPVCLLVVGPQFLWSRM